MSEEQIKEYLEKYNITSKELLAIHIEQLKKNTKPNIRLISELFYVLEDENSVFNSFLREKLVKVLNQHISQATNTPHFLDEVLEQEEKIVYNNPSDFVDAILNDLDKKEKKIFENWNSTRHKSREGEAHKETFIPTDSTNIEVFHIDTKDNGDKTAFIGFKIKNGNFSFVEVPFTSPKKDTLVFTADSEINKEDGKKETEGKLNFELDWEFIEQLAERMSTNKGKYEPFNWKKSMDVEKLKQSLFRHVLEIMKGIYEDDGRAYGHLEAVALNALFINYQLKNNN